MTAHDLLAHKSNAVSPYEAGEHCPERAEEYRVGGVSDLETYNNGDGKRDERETGRDQTSKR